MTKLEKIKEQITKESSKVCMEGTSTIPDMVAELQKLCPHTNMQEYDEDGDILVCTYCGKVFKHNNSD